MGMVGLMVEAYWADWNWDLLEYLHSVDCVC